MTIPPQFDRPIAFSYVRMSTDAQSKGDGRRRQLEMSRRYASLHNLDLNEHFSLEDIGVSAWKGANASVGNFSKIMEAIKSGAIPTGSYLLVENLDRISRQQPNLALTTFMNIINAGITVVTLGDGRSYTAATVKLEDLVYSLIVMSRAHDESQAKSTRSSGAWDAKRANAENLKITSQAPSWLELALDRKSFSVVEDRAKVVRAIFADAVAGIGAYTIARRLNAENIPPFGRSKKWQTSSVHKIITGRAVIGEHQPNRMIDGRRVAEGPLLEDYYPPIIDRETFFAAQTSRLKRRSQGGGRTGLQLSNLFTKIANCAYCGERMHFENKGAHQKGGLYLVCGAHIRGKGCCAKRWRYDDFETTFLAVVEELDLGSLFTSDDEASKRAKLEAEILSLNGELLVAEQQQEATFRLAMQPGLDNSAFMGRKLAESEAKISELASALASKRAAVDLSAEMANQYYESKSQIRDVVARIRNKQGDDVYKERAQIVARLKSLIVRLDVAPLGALPFQERSAQLLRDYIETSQLDVGDAHKVLEHISSPARQDERRYFSVQFRDGTFRVVYQRSEDVRAYVLSRSKGCCEGCKSAAPFVRKDGSPYLEPHHIRRVSDGGPDDPAFVIALCPNCHRRVHAGKDGESFNGQLHAKMPTLEPKFVLSSATRDA
jgi:DNA invertase Pin-like site-specific DNA recombinase/5-methylcytosine-specific restriction endonuclease McrA